MDGVGAWGYRSEESKTFANCHGVLILHGDADCYPLLSSVQVEEPEGSVASHDAGKISLL